MSSPPQASSGFFGGLLGVIGPKIQQQMQEEHEQREAQAKLYMDAIQSGRLSPEQLDYAQQQLQKLYGHSKPVKALLGKVGDTINRLTGHGQGKTQDGTGTGSAAPATPGVPPPPQTAAPAPFPQSPDQSILPAPPGGTLARTGHEYRGIAGTDDLVAAPGETATPQPLSERVPGTNMTSAGPLPPPPGQSFSSIMSAAHPSVDTLAAKYRAAFPGLTDASVATMITGHPVFTAAMKEQHGRPYIGTDGKMHTPLYGPTGEPIGEQIGETNAANKIITKTVNDPASPTGWSYQTIDPLSQSVLNQTPGAPPPIASFGRPAWTMKDGKPVQVLLSKQTGQVIPGTENADVVPPSYMLPHIKEGEFSWTDDEGVLHRAPTTSTTTPVLPGGGGGSKSTGKATATPKGIPAPPSTGSATSTGRVIGPTLKSTENLTPAAQTVLQQTVPVHDQIRDLLRQFEPMKDDNTPGKFLPQRIEYSLGMHSDIGNAADTIAQLELNRVTAGARVLKGSSRAIKALEMAMKHAPNVWKDSPQLIYTKLQNLDKALAEIEDAAHTYGTRSGKLPGKIKPPVPQGGAEPSLDDQIMQAVQGAKGAKKP